MASYPHSVKSRVWIWQGEGAWHFITIGESAAEEIKKDWPWPRRGFGSIPVNVTIGKTTWKTSIFPEKEGSYLLPLKKEVREKEGIKIGDIITVKIGVMS